MEEVEGKHGLLCVFGILSWQFASPMLLDCRFVLSMPSYQENLSPETFLDLQIYNLPVDLKSPVSDCKEGWGFFRRRTAARLMDLHFSWKLEDWELNPDQAAGQHNVNTLSQTD